MPLTPHKRLTQALSDALLAPLLAQHYARVHAQFLRTIADSEPASGPEAYRRQHTRELANLLQREHDQSLGLTTLVITDAQRRILAHAVGDDPQGPDAVRLAAMLRPSPNHGS
jgi:hypothetical protein